MKAVVFRGPFDVKVEDCPIPTIKDDTDAIVKVATAGLCGRHVSTKALHACQIIWTNDLYPVSYICIADISPQRPGISWVTSSSV